MAGQQLAHRRSGDPVLRHDLGFVHWAERTPDAVALIHHGMAVNYRHLIARVRAQIDVLKQAGFGPGRRLALIPRPDLASVVQLLAAIESHTPVVPLHPALPAEEQRRRATAVGASFLEEGAPTERVDPDLFGLLHTSGSSGQAKAVRITRAALQAALNRSEARLRWRDNRMPRPCDLGHDRGDLWGLLLPPAHIGGLSVLLRCLCAGKTVVLGDSPHLLQTILRQQRLTMLSVVPTQLHRMVERGLRAPSHLRVLLVGGAALSLDLKQRAEALGYPVFATYGMTETCAQFSTGHPGQPGVGKPLDGLAYRLEDGELWVKGPTLFDGYEVDGAVKRPFDAEGYFPTGDLAYADDDGYLHVTGRKSDRIITGGENVDPVEVEAALLATGAVAEACVFGLADAEWGETVAAVLVPRKNAKDALDATRSVALARHAIPRRALVVDAIPRSASGKVERRRVAQLFGDQTTPLSRR